MAVIMLLTPHTFLLLFAHENTHCQLRHDCDKTAIHCCEISLQKSSETCVSPERKPKYLW